MRKTYHIIYISCKTTDKIKDYIKALKNSVTKLTSQQQIVYFNKSFFKVSKEVFRGLLSSRHIKMFCMRMCVSFLGYSKLKACQAKQQHKCLRKPLHPIQRCSRS